MSGTNRSSGAADVDGVRRWKALAIWLAGVVICCVVIARTTFTTDLSAFLPKSPTKEQQVLLDQLLDGVISRLILVGIEGSDAPTRAALSKAMAKRLRTGDGNGGSGNTNVNVNANGARNGTKQDEGGAFISINNGEPVNAERDQAFLFGNRYLLSPAVTSEHFTAMGLRDAIGNTLDLLASPAGMMVKPLLPRDPTGEILTLIEQMNSSNRPRMSNGAWASRDGERALLLAQTRAAGTDIDGQQRAMTLIRQAFDEASKTVGPQGAGVGDARLVMTGPGVFSVLSRQTIESEVTRLSIVSTAIIVVLLLIVYRSFTALALGLLPVISGALAGIVAVSLGYGLIHGITLGFGTTLIGEAVDYSIYLFVQSRQAGADKTKTTDDWVRQFWPTIRLGVLTSIAGFASLLASGFPGLAQLGMYSIAGLIVAALVTRYLLPTMLPADFRIRDVSAIGNRLAALAHRAPLLRWPLVLVALVACVIVAQHHATLWNTELSSLSPVSQADQQTDARLRADMGAPDVRYMIVVPGADREAVLQASEKVAAQLQPLVEKGVLAGFESASRYLPSLATQQARQASLPAEGLSARLSQATEGMPVRADIFAPFLVDVAAAKSRPLLQRADMDNTSMALAVDSLVFQRDGRWNALLPLTAPAGAGGSAGLAIEPIRAALAASGQTNALFVDMKAESDNLYSGYLHEAIVLSLAGLGGVVLVLLFFLRSPLRLMKVLLPLLAAVVTVVALHALTGHRMTILHLVGLLLIVAVGSNYALFFTNPDSKGISPQTLTSLVFANLTTVSGFGILGFSDVPVLQAIGATVGPGAVLALLFAASFNSSRDGAGDAHH